MNVSNHGSTATISTGISASGSGIPSAPKQAGAVSSRGIGGQRPNISSGGK
jgi:hypothetical protein|tara:strand:+ start:216 stop:368 length:153 start_codon:yes stop_codon:yes gene_type:complete